jgi:AbrB family looped-hinge helix DNA binding protein
MNHTYSITSKGQITLPKELRDAVGLKPGGRATLVQLDAHTIAIRTPLSAAELRDKVGPPSHKQPLTAKERERLSARGLL